MNTNDKSGWIAIEKGVEIDLPDNQLCAFITWHDQWNIVIQNEVSTWKEVKDFSEYELKKQYTHYMILPNPQTKN